jgi:hypothetical protein
LVPWDFAQSVGEVTKQLPGDGEGLPLRTPVKAPFGDEVTQHWMFVGLHGFGLQAPGPTSVPWPDAQSSGEVTIQLPGEGEGGGLPSRRTPVNAPLIDEVTQHWVIVTLHGFGLQVPGPASVPWFSAQSEGEVTMQLPGDGLPSRRTPVNAPLMDEATQHWVSPVAMVVVVVLRTVVVVTVVLVMPQGFGVHVPDPSLLPPAAEHLSAVSS